MGEQSDALLKLSVTELGSVALVSVAGEVDASNAAELKSCVERLVERGHAVVTLDLTELRFIDSSGLSVLVALHETQRAAGGRLALRGVTSALDRLLEITGLADDLLSD